MPGNVRPVSDERDGLLSFLAQQRYVLRLAAHGLARDPLDAALGVGSVSAADPGGGAQSVGIRSLLT